MDDASSAIEAAIQATKMQGMNQPHTIAKCPPFRRVRREARINNATNRIAEDKSIRW